MFVQTVVLFQLLVSNGCAGYNGIMLHKLCCFWLTFLSNLSEQSQHLVVHFPPKVVVTLQIYKLDTAITIFFSSTQKVNNLWLYNRTYWSRICCRVLAVQNTQRPLSDTLQLYKHSIVTMSWRFFLMLPMIIYRKQPISTTLHFRIISNRHTTSGRMSHVHWSKRTDRQDITSIAKSAHNKMSCHRV